MLTPLLKFNAENYQSLVQNGNAQYAQSISWALKGLNNAGILTPDNRQLLVQNGNAQYAQSISLVLEKFDSAGILTNENYQLLVQNGNAQYAESISLVLEKLNKAKISYQNILDKILNNPKNAGNFIDFVQKNRIKITSENFLRLYKIGAYQKTSLVYQCLGSFWKKPQPIKKQMLPKELRSLLPPNDI